MIAKRLTFGKKATLWIALLWLAAAGSDVSAQPQPDPAAVRQARLAQLAAIDRAYVATRVQLDEYELLLRRAEERHANLSSDLRAERDAALGAKARVGTLTTQEKLARGQRSRARSAHRLAIGQLRRLEMQLKQLLELDPALLQAKEQASGTLLQYKHVKQHALVPLRSTDAYREAAADVAKAEQQIKDLRQRDPPPSRSEIINASNVLLARQQVVTGLERRILSLSISFRTSRLTWMRATLQYWMRRVALSTQMYYHPDRLAAIESVDRARHGADAAEAAAVEAESERRNAEATLRAAAASYDTTAKAYDRAARERNRYDRLVIATRQRLLGLDRQRRGLELSLGVGRRVQPFPAPR